RSRLAASASCCDLSAAAEASAICALRWAMTARSVVFWSSGASLKACSAFCSARSASWTSVGSSWIAMPFLACENSSRASRSDLGGMRSPPHAASAAMERRARGIVRIVRVFMASVALRLLEVCLRLASGVRRLRGLGQLQRQLRLDAGDGDEARRALVVVSDQLFRFLQVFLRELEVELRVGNGERSPGVGCPDVGLGGGPLVVRRRQRAAARGGGSDCSERKECHRRDPHLDLLLVTQSVNSRALGQQVERVTDRPLGSRGTPSEGSRRSRPASYASCPLFASRAASASVKYHRRSTWR